MSSDGTGEDPNLFRKNLLTGAVSLAVTTSGPPNGEMEPGGISDNGTIVAFYSTATNIVGGSVTPLLRGSAFVGDIATGTIQQLMYNPASAGTQGSSSPTLSAAGSEVAFLSDDNDGFSADVLACNLSAGLAQAPACSVVSDAFPVFDPHLAASGTAIEYSAANTAGSTTWQVFRSNLNGSDSGIASVGNHGAVANADTGNSAEVQGISGDGTTVYFSSSATNLDPAATDRQLHAYLRTEGRPGCPAITMIAARGSAEHPQGDGPNGWTVESAYSKDRYKGAGKELYAVYSALHHAKKSVALDSVMYPADTIWGLVNGSYKVYKASVASGTSTVLTEIQLTDHICAGRAHRYILGGYSQGAWVIHDALHMMSSAQLKEIAGIVLFGDPDFLPLTRWVRVYKAEDLAVGSAEAVDHRNAGIPRTVITRTASYCFPHDPVCQLTPWNLKHTLPACVVGSVLLCPHFRYVQDGETAEAAKFLLALLR